MMDSEPMPFTVFEGTVIGGRPSEIWKHPLALRELNRIRMPKGARILTVAEQNGTGCLWEIHDVSQSNEMVERVFQIVGTGHSFDSAPMMYVGTYQTSGNFVWHVFEVPNG